MMIALIILSSISIASDNSKADVSREIILEMTDIDNYILTKTRIYSGNETSIVRKQLDIQFGNDNGFLDESEVAAFEAFYNDYFEQSRWLLMDEGKILKENATVSHTNLSGATNDTDTIITTTFTFDSRPPLLSGYDEHYLNIGRELWKYEDMDGIGKYTIKNNLTILAPKGWRITHTLGLFNVTYTNNDTKLTGNADIDFEWMTVKVVKVAENDPVDGNNGSNSEDILPLLIMITAIIGIMMIIIIALVFRKRKRGNNVEEELGKDEKPSLSQAEIEELRAEKTHIREDIIKVRKDLTEDSISKEEAKSRERSLKERAKEIERTLKSVKPE
jgi:hypothetical protein